MATLILSTVLFATGALFRVAPSNVAAQEAPQPQASEVSPSSSANAGPEPALTPKELLQRARQMFVARDYPAGEVLYKALLIREPDNINAMIELSVVYEAMGKPQNAVGLLERAANLRPDDRDIAERKAKALRKMAHVLQSEIDSLVRAGAHEEALPKLSILIQAQPDNADLYFQKARCHLRLGRPAAAKGEIARAIRLDAADHFLELREQANEKIRGMKVQSLENDARKLLAQGTPGADEEALRMIVQITEFEPEHAWANEQYERLTGKGGFGIGGIGSSSVGRFLGDVWNTSRSITVGVLSAWNQRLWVMVGILLALLILVSPLTRFIVGRLRPRVMLEGNLSHFSIQEVLGFINAHQATGELKIKSRTVSGSFYFANGEIYHCECGKEQGQSALKTLMKKAGNGLFVLRSTGRVAKQTINTPVSLILLDLPERRPTDLGKSSKKKTPSRMSALLKSGS
ncbi:MAG: DUF4388 domain-containing protein [bacterium]|nr:DUF4388 domain-containing protein [bacterium]